MAKNKTIIPDVVSDLLLKVQKISPDATLPAKNNDTDAGIDLYSSVKIVVPGHSTVLVSTGIKMELPAGWQINIRDRSGLASKETVFVKAGVVDPDYRGEVKVVLGNHGNFPYTIMKGDKIAQAILLPVPEVTIQEVDLVSAETNRGEKGFGSSDVKINA